MNPKLEKLKELLKMMDESLTRKEFSDSFKGVVLFVKEAERRIRERVDAEVSKIRDGRDGVDGKDGKQGLKGEKGDRGPQGVPGFAVFGAKGADGKDGRDGRDGAPDTPEQVRDKLESIKEESEKLKIDAIENLRKELDELKARPVGRGGGTSAIGVAQAFKYIAHTEEPSGVIDGANTTYTVKNNIWWIAGFTLNGEQVAELPNFTYSGRTITFSTAIPAAYSGKDFEIKYIGH